MYASEWWMTLYGSVVVYSSVCLFVCFVFWYIGPVPDVFPFGGRFAGEPKASGNLPQGQGKPVHVFTRTRHERDTREGITHAGEQHPETSFGAKTKQQSNIREQIIFELSIR